MQNFRSFFDLISATGGAALSVDNVSEGDFRLESRKLQHSFFEVPDFQEYPKDLRIRSCGISGQGGFLPI